MTTETRWLNSDEQGAWRALILGMNLLTDRLDRDLRYEFGISLAEYEILVRLSENGRSMRMAQIADAVASSRSRVTHTIRRMCDAGLVLRENSPEDGRGVVATLTDDGMDLLRRAAHVHVAGVRAHLVDQVDADDFAALGRVMDTVADGLVSEHPAAEMR